MADPAGGTDSLERDIEQARERLAGTIDQLLYRTNPKTIIGRQVDAARALFVDERGEPRTENIAKVAGGVVGFLVLVALIRRVTRTGR